jgi:hypothetical protein
MLFAEWLAELSVAALIEESRYALPVHTAPLDEIPDYLLEMEREFDLSTIGREDIEHTEYIV